MDITNMEMDIPQKYYDVITCELIEKGVASNTIPHVLTRDYLNRYGVTGSSYNPLVLIDLPHNIMIKHSNAIFMNKVKHMMPLNNLYEYDMQVYVYVEEEGLYRIAGTIGTMGNYGQQSLTYKPSYYVQELRHMYYDVILEVNQGKIIDTIKLNLNTTQTGCPITKYISVIVINDNKVVVTLDNTYFYDRAINKIWFIDKRNTPLQSISCDEALYLNEMLRHHGVYKVTTEYRRAQDMYNTLVDMLAKYQIILNRFGEDLYSGYLTEADIVKDSQYLTEFTDSQIITACDKEYWLIFTIMLNSMDISQKKRIVGFSLLAKNKFISKMPDELILRLYCWRDKQITANISTILNKVNREELAKSLNSPVFKPSKNIHRKIYNEPRNKLETIDECI